MKTPEMVGCDDLRAWLIENGFRCEVDYLKECLKTNWYAYRRTKLPARECECNDGKSMQLVVKPFALNNGFTTHESVEVSLRGEYGGIWYDLKAYSIDVQTFKARMDEIESNLVNAWNALNAKQDQRTHRALLARCLSVIETLDGEDNTEWEMLNALRDDIEKAIGLKPVVQGSLL